MQHPKYPSKWSNGKISDKKAVIPVVKAVYDDKESVRRAAVEALGMFGDERSLPTLERALKDSDGTVAALADLALQNVRAQLKEKRTAKAA